MKCSAMRLNPPYGAASIGSGRLLASPPSEPYVRFSRIRLSSWWFPHRGLSRGLPSCVKREQPGLGEEGVGPALVIGWTESKARPLFLLAQEGAQPSANELVQHDKGAGMGMFEVAEPAAQHRVEVGDDAREVDPARSSRPHPDVILEAIEALLADKPSSGFEPVAEELKTLPWLPAVADMGLVRLQMQAIVRHPGTDFFQGGIGLLAALAQDHEVVCIAPSDNPGLPSVRPGGADRCSPAMG